MEFFLHVLKRLITVLKIPVAIGSKTVGREVGRQESASGLSRIMQNWSKVWCREDLTEKDELVLPVAVDDRTLPQDWLCVAVRAVVPGEKLHETKQLRVLVYDVARRLSTVRRVAGNVDALVRGIGARLDALDPVVEFMDQVPECRVSSQRSLCAFGLLCSL